MHSLPPDPAPHEITSRYLRQSGHYTPSTDRVKWQAFRPTLDDHKTSVFRVQGLTQCEIWHLGDEDIAGQLGHEILALAELSVEQIMDINLRVEPDEPPPRHANIIGWPAAKNEWMSRAQELAAVATLRLRVTPTTSE